MAATESAERFRTSSPPSAVRRTHDETKISFLTTEFWAMVAANAAILIAAAVSDSLDAGRAWTLVAAVTIGYMVSRGLAKSGTKYTRSEDPLNRDNR
jgi:hypothetical protein